MVVLEVKTVACCLWILALKKSVIVHTLSHNIILTGPTLMLINYMELDQCIDSIFNPNHEIGVETLL